MLRNTRLSFSPRRQGTNPDPMHRYGIEKEMWFELARIGLERRGFRLRLQPRSIVVEKEQRLPRLVASAREFLDFAERQGLRVEQAAYEAADRYGDGTSDMAGRATESPFETPVKVERRPQPAPIARLHTAPAPPLSFGRAGLAEARRPDAMAPRPQTQRPGQPAALPVRKLEVRCGELERRNAELESQLAELQAEHTRAMRAGQEAAKQRDLYQMSATAAEDRVRRLQTQVDGPDDERGPDRKFNQLRRYLARELHPDLAGEDAAERAIREALFKRVWAKIEQLQ